MSDNPDGAKVGAELDISYNEASASKTIAALKDVKTATDALTTTNQAAAAAEQANAAAEGLAAEAAKKASEAVKEQAAATKTVIDVLKEIERQKSIDKLAESWAKVALKTKDAAAAQAGLQAGLEGLNATQPEIASAGSTFAAKTATQGFGKTLAGFGSGLRALPSTQLIPGLPSTDAIANIFRIVGGGIDKLGPSVTSAIAPITGLATEITSTLVPSLAAETAATVGLSLVGGGFALILAALAIAFKSASDEASKQADVLNATVESRRKFDKQIQDGLTTEQAQEQLRKLTAARQTEADTLQDIQDAYTKLTPATESATEAWKLLSPEEEALSTQLNNSRGAITGMDTDITQLNTILNNGSLAANDAAAAAEAATQATLDSADAAGQKASAEERASKASYDQNKTRLEAIESEKRVIQSQIDVLTASGDTSKDVTDHIAELTEQLGALGEEADFINDKALAAAKAREDEKKATQDLLSRAAAEGQFASAQHSALEASEEQNQKRLQSIQDESNAIQAQIDVLQSSGNTSKEVTDQLAKLNGQLGSLSKESDFIKNTALAISRQRDEEKKAAEDAEKAAKKRLDAAQKYGDKLVDIATAAADKAEDRLEDLKDKLGKNELDFGRDIAALSVKSNQDRQEAEIAAQQNEAADLRAHQHDLEAIRDEASLNERNALRKGNYLQAAEIREAANAALEKQNKDFVFAQGEKNIGQDEAAAKDDRELDNARQKRLLALQQQNDDARTAFQEAERDDKTARERQQRDAAITRDRDLRAANELATAKLGIEQQVGNAMLQIAGNTLQGIMALGQNMAPQFNYAGAGNSSTTNNNQRTIGSVNFDQRGIPGSGIGVDQAVLRMLGQLGFVERR